MVSKKDRVTMAKSGIPVANCYDYPQYYDIALQACTSVRPTSSGRVPEVLFLRCPSAPEPACGSGRLVTEL